LKPQLQRKYKDVKAGSGLDDVWRKRDGGGEELRTARG
jgi:hypothetical protein